MQERVCNISKERIYLQQEGESVIGPIIGALLSDEVVTTRQRRNRLVNGNESPTQKILRPILHQPPLSDFAAWV